MRLGRSDIFCTFLLQLLLGSSRLSSAHKFVKFLKWIRKFAVWIFDQQSCNHFINLLAIFHLGYIKWILNILIQSFSFPHDSLHNLAENSWVHPSIFYSARNKIASYVCRNFWLWNFSVNAVKVVRDNHFLIS